MTETQATRAADRARRMAIAMADIEKTRAEIWARPKSRLSLLADEQAAARESGYAEEARKLGISTTQLHRGRQAARKRSRASRLPRDDYEGSYDYTTHA